MLPTGTAECTFLCLMYSSQSTNLFSWLIAEFWKPAKNLPKRTYFQAMERFFRFCSKKCKSEKKSGRLILRILDYSPKMTFFNFRQKSIIFKLSHIGEFLSYEALMGLIFSEIGHTLRLEQNKIHFSILKMIKNIKHPAAKRIKIIFSLSRKKTLL